jgi:hypothetical protein
MAYISGFYAREPLPKLLLTSYWPAEIDDISLWLPAASYTLTNDYIKIVFGEHYNWEWMA